MVRTATTTLLLDCGFGARETRRRLARLGLELESLDANLITHEHGDHVGGLDPVARQSGAEVWMTHGTRLACRPKAEVKAVVPDREFTIGDITVHPYPVPHDAREPCQFVFAHGGWRLGVLSDLGRFTPRVVEALSDCDALMIEANHDPVMLQDGPYPPSLKDRVAGPLGHLSNDQAAALLRRVDSPRVQCLVLTHLSETNNAPELARDACAAATGRLPQQLVLADQDNGTSWLAVTAKEPHAA